MVLSGCASPPSVAPLMRVVETALGDEVEHVAADERRMALWYSQQRDALADAFGADLAAQSTLAPDWVSDHVRVYVAAREALAEAGVRARQQYAVRRDNLLLAAAAQRRARELIEKQDQLIAQVPGVGLLAAQRREIGDAP
jgi:hypothetical protein